MYYFTVWKQFLVWRWRKVGSDKWGVMLSQRISMLYLCMQYLTFKVRIIVAAGWKWNFSCQFNCFLILLVDGPFAVFLNIIYCHVCRGNSVRNLEISLTREKSGKNIRNLWASRLIRETWQLHIMTDLKVIVVSYTIGDNVVCGICWVSVYPCWFICQRNHIIAKHANLLQ